MQSVNQSTTPRSGCGPGASVPAGTPQEGVRGPVVTREELCKKLLQLDRQLRHTHPFNNEALARLHQQLADTYAALAGMVGK